MSVCVLIRIADNDPVAYGVLCVSDNVYIREYRYTLYTCIAFMLTWSSI